MARGSHTKVTCFKRCKRKFYYMYILDLQRKIQSIAPSRGKYLHECLEYHYAKKDYTEVIRNVVIEKDKLFEEERAEWEDLPDELLRIMRSYTLAYKDIDRNIKTIALEKEFTLNIGGHEYEVRIDWIFEDDKGVWVADHKTVKTIPEDEIAFTDIQTTLYFEAAKQMGIEPTGVVFNYIRTKAPRQPKILKKGGISRAACDTDVATYMATVRAAGYDPKDYEDMIEKLSKNVFFKRSRIPRPEKLVKTLITDVVVTLDEINRYEKMYETTKEKEYFPRTLSKTCSWDCEYPSLCFAELTGHDVKYIIENDFEERRKKK